MKNPHTWAVVLAGGDGTRLKSLTRLISGDSRPKQFCPIFDGKTLLTQTRSRLAKAVAPDHTLFVVVKAHERFYKSDLADVDPSRLVIQPENKGTAAAIAFSLLRILQADEEAIVGYFPADHYFEQDGPFLAVIDSAFELAQQNTDSLVLLGAEPHQPEIEYGWIEPGAGYGDCTRVSRFWEKPSLDIAKDLLKRGCLWNTFVMVGRARMFLDLLAATVPELLQAFEPVAPMSHDGSETKRVRRLYRSLPPVDFSHQVLAKCTDRLLLLRLGDARWSDLGKPERVMATLEEAGIQPQWAASISQAPLAGVSLQSNKATA